MTTGREKPTGTIVRAARALSDHVDRGLAWLMGDKPGPVRHGVVWIGFIIVGFAFVIATLFGVSIAFVSALEMLFGPLE